MIKKNLSKITFLLLIATLFVFTGCTNKTSNTAESNKEPVKQDSKTTSNKQVVKENNSVKPNKEISNNNSKKNDSTINNKTESNKETVKENSSVKSNKENNNIKSNKENFYGNWKIDSIIGYSKVSALSDKEAKSLIGNKITYSKNLAQFNENKCINPNYKKEILKKENCYDNFKITFKNLGINKQTMQIVTIINNKTSNTWNSNGSVFFVSDNNNLILYVSGVFFKVTRC